MDYLSGLGLIQPRVPEAPVAIPAAPAAPTLDDWFDQFIQGRQGSEGTKIVWTRSKNQAVKFFGKSCPIDSITTGDAITWYERMLNGDSKGKGKLAETLFRLQ